MYGHTEFEEEEAKVFEVRHKRLNAKQKRKEKRAGRGSTAAGDEGIGEVEGVGVGREDARCEMTDGEVGDNVCFFTSVTAMTFQGSPRQ